MSTPVHAVATPLNTCRVSRACCDKRFAPCCPTSATCLDTSSHDFSLCLGSVSCRDVTSQVEYGLMYANQYMVSVMLIVLLIFEQFGFMVVRIFCIK